MRCAFSIWLLQLISLRKSAKIPAADEVLRYVVKWDWNRWSDWQDMKPRGLAPRISRIPRGAVRAVLLAAVLMIVYFGLISESPLPDHRLVVGFNDLIPHFLAFAILTTSALLLWQDAARAFCILVTGAFLLESLQALRPVREFSMLDLGASVAGVAASAFIILLVRSVVVRQKNFIP